MPRRIPEYPTPFRYWNYLASFGSIITSAAMAVFILAVFVLLVRKHIPFFVRNFVSIKSNVILKDQKIKFLKIFKISSTTKFFDYWYYFALRSQRKEAGLKVRDRVLHIVGNVMTILPLIEDDKKKK